MTCPSCHLPPAQVVLDRECPFCSVVFSRVDSARRHAKRCGQRGDRVLDSGKRGRKVLACDQCSHLKIYCNARLQTPCDVCNARKLECVFSRYCTCSSGGESFDRQRAEETSPLRNPHGAAPLSFLLNSTDDTQDFVTESAVGREPNASLLGPISATLPQGQSVDYDLPDFIDPSLLLSSYDGTAFVDFGEVSETTRNEDGYFLNPLLSLRAHGDDLAARITMLESQLVSHALKHNIPFDTASFNRIFGTAKVHEFATTFCRKRHYRYPIIHWPTFSLRDAPLPLLLVVVLTGASYSYVPNHEPQHIHDARYMYPVADSFVFEQLGICLECESNEREAIQLCQAALLMYGLDTLLVRDPSIQHKAIMQRLPAVVSAIRRLSLTGTRHVVSDDWTRFLIRESAIRLVTWAFCADCLANLTCNSPPLFSLPEMTGHLPSDPDLWDADSAEAFEAMRSSRPQQPTYSLMDLMSQLLGNEPLSDSRLDQLPLHHLHVVLCAFQPLIYNLHVSLALPSQSSNLIRALSIWRSLWDRAAGNLSDDHRRWLGVARYVPRIEYFSRRVIQVAVSPEATSSRYLQRIPMNGMKEVHEFLRDFVVRGQPDC